MVANTLFHRQRDIIVIGCSAGGVEALPRVLERIPRNLRAAIFIVQHMAPTSARYLVGILSRASALPVGWAEQGGRVERGTVTVAPPDVHMMFSDEHVSLT